MLGFAVPLRHPDSCRDYDVVCRDLQATLESIAAQTSPEWEAVVVGNQRPDVSLPDFSLPDKVRFVELDVPVPALDEHGHPAYRDRILDKGKKLAAAIGILRDRGATHVMPVDADDFVHHHLAATVADNPEHPGWYSPEGFVNLRGTNRLWGVDDEFHLRNGSTHVLPADLLPIPPHTEQGGVTDPPAIDDTVVLDVVGRHTKWSGFAAAQGTPLQPLPFASSIYVVGTGENVSGVNYQSGDPRPLDPEVADIYGIRRVSRWINGLRLTRAQFTRLQQRIARRRPSH